MQKLKTILTACMILSLAVLFWLVMYQYDNKYTAGGPQAVNGVLSPDGPFFSDPAYVFLIDGWEYYGSRLLSPEDFKNQPPKPDRYIFIGRYGGFENGNKNASPHGSASYRLVIELPDEMRTYMLELPEIFSAYRLYINGTLAASMGCPDPLDYQPQTGNRAVSVEAAGSIELLFAVSDFSHLYSGMVYPAAFGQPDAVAGLLHLRLFFRTVLCTAALTIGLLTALIGLLNRKYAPAVLYSLLCLLFIGYISYPITQTFFIGYQPKYVIENFSFCAMLVIVILLGLQICHIPVKKGVLFLFFGELMCLWTAMGPYLWNLGNLQIMLLYSRLISAYQWTTAIFLTAAAIYGISSDTIHARPLLYGILIFNTALVTDRLLPLYEPIITGWFLELGSFFLVASIGIVIGQEVAAHYRNAAILTERAGSMERLYQQQQTYYKTLKQGVEESKKIRHDIRHHFTSINGFVQNRQYEKLSSYLSEFIMISTPKTIKEFCPIDVINILSQHYDKLAIQNQIRLDIRCDLNAAGINQRNVKMSDADLSCLYSNLMENAVEACLRVENRPRSIRVAIIRSDPNSLTIRIWNSADNSVRPHGDSFLSSKAPHRHGYGLLSIRSIAMKYNGNARFHWNKEKQEFESIVTLMV